jgi:hypothetical protein
MTLSGLTRSAVAVAATAGLALSTAPSDARQANGPDFGAPTVGACSTMTADQSDAASDKSTVVPCSQDHTAKVAGVVQLPAKLDYSAGTAALYKVVLKRCRPLWNDLLGRTAAVRDSSAYQLVWFNPTQRQQNHGARWLSCSVVLRQGSTLAKLPTNKSPLLPTGKLGDRIHRCLLATTSAVVTTRCKAKHGWRATGAFVIDSDHYPGAKTINRTARKKCVSRTDRDKAYRWTYWTKLGWQAGGDHAVICYTKTTS